MAAAQHEVRSLADLEHLEAAYGHLPEAFLHHHPVEVHVRGVDKLSNAARMYTFLQRQVERYGWVAVNLGHLSELALLGNALGFVRDELLPAQYTFPADPELHRLASAAGFLLRELGARVQDPTVQRRASTIGHRVVFTARRAWGWEEERIRNRILAHFGELSHLLELQVLFP